MWPFNQLGSALGSKLQKLIAGAFEAAMQALWDAALFILREAFQLADRFSVFTVSTTSGAVSLLWPMMLWTSGVLALGLFFWQLAMTSLRGGRGFMRLVTGPMQYGIALAVTVSMVAGLLAGTDGLTDGILEYGLQSENFSDALQHTAFADGAVDGVKAVVLGICAFVGVIPAGIGYVLEMLFREAAVYLLVATIPITAAGLLANVTASWFWKTARWMLACILMKPVLALTLVLGVAISGGSKGLSGLLAGVGVLIISLLCPFVLFRLFAFVDPNSDAGAAFRDALSRVGIDSYGSGNPAMQAAGELASGGGSGSAGDSSSGGGGDAQEAANPGRFDEAMADDANGEMSTYGVGSAPGSAGGGSGQDGQSSSPGSPSGSSGSADSDTESPSEGTDDSSPRPAANQGQVVASNGVGPLVPQPTNAPGESSAGDQAASGGGGSSSAGGLDGGGEQSLPPEPPDPGGNGPTDDGDGSSTPRGGGGPKSSGGGGGGASAGEADAAVIV